MAGLNLQPNLHPDFFVALSLRNVGECNFFSILWPKSVFICSSLHRPPPLPESRSVQVGGAYDTKEGFQLLDKAISEYELSKNSTEGSSRRFFYLALSPFVDLPVCKMIKSYCMNKSDLGGWTRIVVEKPFGKDLASAEELISQIGELFDELQIYRVDHYLGKELVQNFVTTLKLL